jgi:hypothetical protein
MSGIPFTQYLRPTGRAVERWIARPEDIEAAARRFIEAGGNYTAEILRTDEVSLAAVKRIEGELRDVEVIVCSNDFEVLAGVDKLVLLSVAHIGKADRDDTEPTSDPASES